MKQITELRKINLTKLNNDEYAQFIRALHQLIETATAQKLNLEPEVLQELQKQNDMLTDATRQTRLSKETTSINELDKKRSQLVSFLLMTFRNERRNVVETRKEAAIALYNLTKNYSGIQSMPIRSKTQTIEGLLKDLNKPSENAHIQTLGLGETLSALASYNKEVEKLFFGRAEYQVTNKLINTKAIRTQVGKLYKYIAHVSFATNIIEPSAESQTFLDLLNKLIDDTNTAQKQRSATSPNKAGAKGKTMPSTE